MLKALDQLRLSQREAVQCFDERHHRNFVGMIRFANLASKKRAASAIADAAIQMLRANGSEREIHAGADHTKIVVGAVHKIPAEITDPADVRG